MHHIAVQLCEVCIKSELVHSLMLVPLYVVQLGDYLGSQQRCNLGLEVLNSCATSVQRNAARCCSYKTWDLSTQRKPTGIAIHNHMLSCIGCSACTKRLADAEEVYMVCTSPQTRPPDEACSQRNECTHHQPLRLGSDPQRTKRAQVCCESG